MIHSRIRNRQQKDPSAPQITNKQQARPAAFQSDLSKRSDTTLAPPCRKHKRKMTHHQHAANSSNTTTVPAGIRSSQHWYPPSPAATTTLASKLGRSQHCQQHQQAAKHWLPESPAATRNVPATTTTGTNNYQQPWTRHVQQKTLGCVIVSRHTQQPSSNVR
jgi:hypothetical protein